MIAVSGCIDRDGVDAECARLSPAFAAGGRSTVMCDLGALDDAALPAVDVLARLALLARRRRCEMRLEHASPAILELLDLCGLADVLRCGDPRPAAGDSDGEVSR